MALAGDNRTRNILENSMLINWEKNQYSLRSSLADNEPECYDKIVKKKSYW